MVGSRLRLRLRLRQRTHTHTHTHTHTPNTAICQTFFQSRAINAFLSFRTWTAVAATTRPAFVKNDAAADADADAGVDDDDDDDVDVDAMTARSFSMGSKRILGTERKERKRGRA